MKLNELKLKNYADVIRESAYSRKDSAFYAILPKTIVYLGKGNINEQYCKEHDIDVYKSMDFGGGIVASKGDLVFVIIKENGQNIGYEIVNLVIEYLKNKGINAKFDNNDIILENQYKCASYSSVNVGDDFIYTGIQISFDLKPGIIKEICLKDSTKIPRGLTEYSVKNTEILYIIQKYIENNIK